MKTQEDITTEDEPQPLHPMMVPTEADPETAALTAGNEPDEPEAAFPEEEQEDPYDGRSLPGEEEPEFPEELEAEADELSPDGAAELSQPPPPPMVAPPAAAPQAETADGARSALAEMKHQYWRRVLTGAAHTVPDDVRERAGVNDAGLTEEQRDYRLLSTINRSWAADHLGISREEVRTDWGRLREQLTRRFHVADDEQELFAALAIEAQDAPRREQAKTLYETHYRAALLGRESPAAELPGEEEPWASELAEDARERGAALRKRYLPLAREVAEGLNVFAGLEEEAIPAPRVLSAVPEFARSVEALAGMDENARQLVYAIAQEEFRSLYPQKDASLYRTMLRASRRGATGMGIGVGQAAAHAAIASMHSLGSMLGEEWGRGLREGADALDLRSRIVEETRRLLYEEVKPLELSEQAGFAAQLAVDAAGAAPAAVVACAGGAGFAALGISGMGEAVAAARQRAPEGSQWLQYLAGIVGGGIQASIYSGMSRVGGQMLSNAIGNFARASGKGAGGYKLASLGVLGAMGLEEAKLLFAAKTADAAGLGAQELAARLERTASNIDWKAYGDNAQDIELNLREAAMTLPFVLIASGRVALRHFRSRDAVLGDGHALQRWGIDEATRDAIMKERDINRQGDMLRDALRGSRRWSAPGFIVEAARALRLLNVDYYQHFKDPQTVVDFLNLPSQGGLVPRPPFVSYSAENPQHVKLLEARHGSGEKVNRRRLPMALQLWDEWWQKAHLDADHAQSERKNDVVQLGESIPTRDRRYFFGNELMRRDGLMARRLRPGGFYAPRAEAERMALLRDRVAEIHDLSYQLLLSSFPLDALSHSTRGLDHMRQASDTARRSLLEAIGRSVIRRATGTPEQEALDELGVSINNYFWRRRYTNFPPGWMSLMRHNYTKQLDESARATFSQSLEALPPEYVMACRVALGFRACAGALYELLPTTPDFQTALSRGLSPAEAYIHLLSRELGVDMMKAVGVPEMLAPLGAQVTDRSAYTKRNEQAFENYRRLTGLELEKSRGEDGEADYWRARRPNGGYTNWHLRREDAINDLVANASFTFMPFSYDRMEPLYNLRPGKGYDLNAEGKAGAWLFTGYDNLCRVALRDAARSWVETAPYAQPGFEMDIVHRNVYIGGAKPKIGAQLKEADEARSVRADSYMLSSPLRLAQARFHTYWWRQLRSGLLPAEQAGDELVRLRIISPEELVRVKDIAKPLLMPRRKDVPLRLTPPPDIPGMHRALAGHLSDLTMRYFLSHLDEVPLPHSTREWFRLAPLCQLEPAELPARAVRLSMKTDTELFTSLHNRIAARELREFIPAVEEFRRAEQEGELAGSPLAEGLLTSIGINRAQNLEQAWCMEQSGGEAMMAASPAFWRLLHQPLEGWKGMDVLEQEALRRHVEPICRMELSPGAMEAEARGEVVDYVQEGLLNLQDVLQDYPQLHRYNLIDGAEGLVLHRLKPDGLLPGSRKIAALRPEDLPVSELEYEPVPLYLGGKLQQGYHREKAAGVLEYHEGDSRVLPALHLLGQLRTYPATRPYVRREGIQWNGELYGGPLGRPPTELEKGWAPEDPLRDMVHMLQKVDELKANMPEGETLKLFDIELPGLGEELNWGPLRHVTLYRNLENPSVLCRLMPGEPEVANVAARMPYVVESIGSVSLGNGIVLREAGEMHRSYVPMEHFRFFKSRMGTERARKAYSEVALDYTLTGMLSSTMRMASQANPQGGLVSLRELLMRFAEDSGFSRSLRDVDPRELRYGQLQALRLGRELLLCVCGSDPASAYRRFISLSHRIRRSKETRGAVLRTLIASADELYSQGRTLFRLIEPKRRRYKRRKGPVLKVLKTAEDARNLRKWSEENEGMSGEGDLYMLDGYNDDVRTDGYSKGFFDD